MNERNYVKEARQSSKPLDEQLAAAIYDLCTFTMLTGMVWAEAEDELTAVPEYVKTRGVTLALMNVKWSLADCLDAIKQVMWKDGENAYIQDFAIAANEVADEHLTKFTYALSNRLGKMRGIVKPLPLARMLTAQSLAAACEEHCNEAKKTFARCRLMRRSGSYVNAPNVLEAISCKRANQAMKTLAWLLIRPHVSETDADLTEDPDVRRGITTVLQTIGGERLWEHAMKTANERNGKQ